MIAGKYPFLSSKALIREEAEGGIFISGAGPFKMITSQDLDVLSKIDGQRTVYDIARGISKNDSELAFHLIRLLDMAREGIVELKDEGSSTFRPALLSDHPPFSSCAFSSPVLVSLGLTSECNRKCTHCYRAGYRGNGALGDDELTAAIRQLAELKVVELNFTGGEPLLNPNIAEYVSIAASMINSVTISSNCTLIDSCTLLTLGKAGLRRIQFGINVIFDSPDTETAEEDRKQITGMFGEAAQAGIEIIVGAVLTLNLIEHIESVFDIAKAMGARTIRLGPLMNCHVGCSGSSISSRIVVDSVLKARRLGQERGLSVIFGDGLTAPSDAPEKYAERKRYCFLGTGILHIESDGSIYPCSALLAPEYCLGSVRNNSTGNYLMNIWRNSDVLNSLRNLTIDQLSSCSCCEIGALCGGGCRTAAYWSTGDIAGISPFCEASKELLGKKCTSPL